MCVSNFLVDDVGICKFDVDIHKFGELVGRFVARDTFVKSYVCFDYSLLKPTSTFYTDSTK
jgi:hypothetical protein